jgi:hypothetical protein
MMEQEIWKDIPGYDGIYQASNSGKIKNLARLIKRSRGGFQNLQESIKVPFVGKSGYATVALSVDGKPKTKYVHRLVASAFYGPSELVVDHINSDKSDNRIENLRYVTQRSNVCFGKRTKQNHSLPIGVSLNPCNYKKRFRSRIKVNNRLLNLGSYDTDELAHRVYLEKSNSVELINNANLQSQLA